MNEQEHRLNALLENLDVLMAVIDQNNYLDVNDPTVMALMPEKNTPEKLLVRKDNVNKLSREAQQVIEIIYNAPRELLMMIPINKEFISSHNLKKYLKKNGWCRHNILKAFHDIRKMLKEE